MDVDPYQVALQYLQDRSKDQMAHSARVNTDQKSSTETFNMDQQDPTQTISG